MLFGVPNRTPYDLEFSVLGVPVRVHPLFWLVTILLGSGSGPFDFQLAALWVCAVFVSILIHEMGHAVAILYYGGYPSVILYAGGGLALHDPGRLSRRGDRTVREIAISFAGPLAGFIFAGILAGCLYASGFTVFVKGIMVYPGGELAERNELLWMLFCQLFWINIGWGLVNLLPILPLDGGHIAEALLVRFYRREGWRYALMLSIGAAAAMAVYSATTLHNSFMTIFFAAFAFSNFQQLQAEGRARW